MPDPVTTGENVLGILKFSYASTASPTTLAGVFVEVTVTPAAAFNNDLSSSFCNPKPGSANVIRCDLGNVRKGSARTMFVVVTAPTETSISMAGVAFWNENVSGKNPQPNNSILSDPPAEASDVVAGTATNASGKCTVGGSTLQTGTLFGASNRVATSVQYHGNSEGLPCTPASVVDDIEITVVPAGASCTASPCLGSGIVLAPMSNEPTSDRATVTITWDGSLFPPPGPKLDPDTFVVYESVDGTTAEPVPFCSTGAVTSFGTCEVGAVRFGVRGVQVTLLVPGSGIDPNYFG